MDMEYDDILQALCDVWERVKEIMREFAERLRELFGSLSKVVEPGKPIKVTDYRCHRDFTFVQSIHIFQYSAEICRITEEIFKIWR